MTDLDLTRLRCFIAVAEEKHFTRAATRMHMTPPPLSRQIRRLERELGGSLFVRNYHDVQLTPFAEQLLPKVREALSAVDAVSTTAAQLIGRAEPLRVAATPYAPRGVLGAYADLLAEAGAVPENDIVMNHGTLELTRKLEAGDIDIGLVHLPVPDKVLSSVPLYDYQLGVAVRNDDPMANRDSVTLDDLRGRRMMHPLGSLQPWVLEEHREIFERYRIDVVLDRFPEAFGVSEFANEVWTKRLATFTPLVEGSMLTKVFGPPDFVVLPVEGESLTMHTGIAWRTERTDSPALARIVDQARRKHLRE